METAHYGRMTLGRCGTGESTSVSGCSEDVLWYLARRCSGRTRCKVYIADPVLHHLNPCTSDYTAYLQAKYTCVSVSGSERMQSTNNNSTVSTGSTNVRAAAVFCAVTLTLAYDFETEPKRKYS